MSGLRAEPAPRATFRSGALSQPSQMGNFKHQSTRTNDRDRERDLDRDGGKEREREIRDREGQERLRSVRRPSLYLPATGGLTRNLHDFSFRTSTIAIVWDLQQQQTACVERIETPLPILASALAAYPLVLLSLAGAEKAANAARPVASARVARGGRRASRLMIGVVVGCLISCTRTCPDVLLFHRAR